MFDFKPIDTEAIRAQLPTFREGAEKYFSGQMNMKEYKGFSGKYGSYSQRGGKKSMLRLRMSAGRVTKDKLKFVVDMADKYDVDLIHFTTCQTIQFHNLELDPVCDIMDKAFDAGIVCYGGGGDYPRNVMCSPLSGVEEEYFDVMPYAQAAADFLVDFIDQEKMPRKLKVGFSNSKANAPHATFRDLGFAARPDGNFDVYAAGGLGVNPSFGTLVAENVPPQDTLYYIEAMIRVFRQYGNYDNRTKARTRYLKDTLGEKPLADAIAAQVAGLKAEKDLTLPDIALDVAIKQPKGEPCVPSFLIREQKQPGLYSVLFHPKGGSPRRQTLRALYEAIKDMEGVELRLAPDESAWIINLNADEARLIAAIIDEETAHNTFETSISCIGASICQVGLRDSQSLLARILKEVPAAGLPDDALPQLHISGCGSSCGTHQVGKIGFRGGVKVVDRKPVQGFFLFVNGSDRQDAERMADEVGFIDQEQIPAFLIDLGQTVMAEERSFDEWVDMHPEGIAQIAGPYLIQ